MRTAGRKHDLPQGCFVIALGFELHKAYSALAHGARHVNFWRYGPAYANYLPYSWSNNRQAVRNVGLFCRDVAAIEDLLLEAEREAAEVALLYAKADPLWGRSQAENRLVYFALLHDQVPCDIITEEEIEEDDILRRYRFVYITDVSVRGATQRRLAQWVEDGGRIWLSGNAATRDEFDEPCAVLADALTAPGKGGSRVLDCRPGEAYEKPVRDRHNRTVGKGRIQGGWDADLRAPITDFVKTAGVARPATVDVPCVETVLYRHDSAALVFLINYTGESELASVSLSVEEGRRVTGARSVRHGPVSFRQENGRVRIALPLAAADVVVLQCEAP